MSLHPAAYVRKNTNQSTPRIRTASPVDTVKSASTEGPGSAWRASVAVSTIWPSRRVAMGASFCVSACNASYCRDTTCRKQRLIANHVPEIGGLHLYAGAKRSQPGAGTRRLTQLVKSLAPACLKRGPLWYSGPFVLLRLSEFSPWPPA